jgi:hypothetical protein
MVRAASRKKGLRERKMADDRQRRRWERFSVMIEVNVTMMENGKYVTFAGQASDVSKGGLRLFVTRAIDLGASLNLQFLLPYYSTKLEMRGVVRNREGFTHGVEFIAPTSDQQHIITRTCDVFALLRG